MLHEQQGGVGIVFNASRSGCCLLVKSLVPGGAADKSCAVEVGHQIIAVGDRDVSSCNLEEVAGMLKGPVSTEVQLKFLETRRVKLTMERCVFMNDGTPSVGIRWKDGSSELIVDGMMPGYQGFGGTPKAGDRLLTIGGEAIEHMADDEIWAKLAGAQDSSVRLEFARGVAHHSVTLIRQPLTLVPTTGVDPGVKSNPDEQEGPDTITAAPITMARELQTSQNRQSPPMPVSPVSSNGDYMSYQSGSPAPAAQAKELEARRNTTKPATHTQVGETDFGGDSSNKAPLNVVSPNKEMPHVIKAKVPGASTHENGIPRIGVNSRISPATTSVHHFSQPLSSKTQPPTTAPNHEDPGISHAQDVYEAPHSAISDQGPRPSAREEECVQYNEDDGAGSEDHAGEAAITGDPTQLVLKKQLVDIAKRLKREVEDKDLEIASLREAQGNPDALQKLVERGQEQIRALRDRLKQQQQKLAEAESSMAHRDSELATIKKVLMRRAENTGQSKKQLEDLTSTLIDLSEEKKVLAIAKDKLEADLRVAEIDLQELRESREMDHKNFRDAAELTVKWKMGEVDKQLKDLQIELGVKREECNGALKHLQMTQEANSATEAKLQDALAELKRVRESNAIYDGTAKEYKAQCAQLERDLLASERRFAETSASNAEKLKNNDAEWEARSLKLRQDMTALACERDQAMEEQKARYAQLQEEMDQARGLMEEARNKILSLEDEKSNALDCSAQLKEDLKTTSAKLEVSDSEVLRLTNLMEQQAQVHKETVDEMQSTFDGEEASLKQQLQASLERIKDLKDEKGQIDAMLNDAEASIKKQSEAILEERKATSDWQEKAAMLEVQVKKLNDELRVLPVVTVELEVANGRLRSLDELQARLKFEAKQREDFRKQVQGQNMPYHQLARLAEDTSVSVTQMQGVIASKEQELIFYRTQLNEVARTKEMSAEAERQLWALKESLDWKTIAVQQLMTALSKCQEVMKRFGVPEEHTDQIACTLQVNQHHAVNDAIDTSKWPFTQKPQPQQDHLLQTQAQQAPRMAAGEGPQSSSANQLGVTPPPPKPLQRGMHASISNPGQHTSRESTYSSQPSPYASMQGTPHTPAEHRHQFDNEAML